jgi:hypothetical protein
VGIEQAHSALTGRVGVEPPAPVEDEGVVQGRVHRDSQGTGTYADGAQHGAAADVDHAHAVIRGIGDEDVAAALIHRERMVPLADGNRAQQAPADRVQHMHAVGAGRRTDIDNKDAPWSRGDG